MENRSLNNPEKNNPEKNLLTRIAGVLYEMGVSEHQVERYSDTQPAQTSEENVKNVKNVTNKLIDIRNRSPIDTDKTQCSTLIEEINKALERLNHVRNIPSISLDDEFNKLPLDKIATIVTAGLAQIGDMLYMARDAGELANFNSINNNLENARINYKNFQNANTEEDKNMQATTETYKNYYKDTLAEAILFISDFKDKCKLDFKLALKKGVEFKSTHDSEQKDVKNVTNILNYIRNRSPIDTDKTQCSTLIEEINKALERLNYVRNIPSILLDDEFNQLPLDKIATIVTAGLAQIGDVLYKAEDAGELANFNNINNDLKSTLINYKNSQNANTEGYKNTLANAMFFILSTKATYEQLYKNGLDLDLTEARAFIDLQRQIIYRLP